MLFKRKGKIEIFIGENNQFYFRIVAANGEIVSTSEGYSTKQKCLEGYKSVKENIGGKLVDLT